MTEGFISTVPDRDAITAETANRILSAASLMLGSSLDLEDVLVAASGAVLPDLADCCIVEIDEPAKKERRLIVEVSEGCDGSLPQALPERIALDTGVAPDASIAVGLPRGVYPDLSSHHLLGTDHEGGRSGLLMQAGFGSAMCAPLLLADGRSLGVITFLLCRNSGRRYDGATYGVAIQIARRVAQALEHARLYGEAQEAIRARDELLTIAAHELKAPVTSLRGYAQLTTLQLTEGRNLDPARLSRVVQTFDEQTAKLSRLITELFDFSRLEAGKSILERSETDLVALVDGVVEAVKLTIDQNLHPIALHMRKTWLMAYVDPLRMEQVMTNLVSNAVKHSPDGGGVEIEVSTTETGAIQISVRDHGPGIPVEHQGRVFDRFYQVHTKSSAGGMGLGLFISRQIVEQHGGRIVVESPIDGGTRFVVTLPIDVVRDIRPTMELALTAGPPPMPDPGQPSAGAGETKHDTHREPIGRVMVIEDNVKVRDLVKAILSDQGYHVVTAPHGADALRHTQQYSPNVILLDLRMPTMDGWEFARSYRQLPGPHAPIIILSAAHDGAKRAKRLGADDFIGKPFEIDDLLRKVGQHSSRR
jgi:signal transduction histidine kinase